MRQFYYFLSAIALIFISNQVSGQPVRLIDNQETKFTIIQNDYSVLQFSNSLSELNSIGVKTDQKIFSEITAPGYGWSVTVGDPKLPVLKKVIEIPLGAECVVEILSQASTEYNLRDLGILHRILPAQLPVSKSIENPEDIPFVLNQVSYLTDAFLSHDLVTVTQLGEMRCINLARLEISPFEYKIGRAHV